MHDRHCPHCGHALARGVNECVCGFSFTDEDTQVPAPAIVRSARQVRPGSAAPAGRAVAALPQAESRGTATERRVRVVERATARPNETMLMACPTCSARISKRAPQCPKCGSDPYAHCQICATRILANSAFCPECGDPRPFEAA